MNNEDIRSVIALMGRYGIAAFDYEHGSVQLRLTLGSEAEGATIAGPNPASKMEPDMIRSPGVGTVLHAHPAYRDPPPTLPRKMVKGEVVAYIKTGLTLRSVVTERDCLLRHAVVAEGAGVGYGDALFEIAS